VSFANFNVAIDGLNELRQSVADMLRFTVRVGLAFAWRKSNTRRKYVGAFMREFGRLGLIKSARWYTLAGRRCVLLDVRGTEAKARAATGVKS
jgi:hypothetical protein